jgi:hypothetical protein
MLARFGSDQLTSGLPQPREEAGLEPRTGNAGLPEHLVIALRDVTLPGSRRCSGMRLLWGRFACRLAVLLR